MSRVRCVFHPCQNGSLAVCSTRVPIYIIARFTPFQINPKPVEDGFVGICLQPKVESARCFHKFNVIIILSAKMMENIFKTTTNVGLVVFGRTIITHITLYIYWVQMYMYFPRCCIATIQCNSIPCFVLSII